VTGLFIQPDPGRIFRPVAGWGRRHRRLDLGGRSGPARIGVAFAGGPTLSILAGFSLSDWNGLVFRELPFSVEYRAGAAGGPVLGAEAEIPLLRPEPGIFRRAEGSSSPSDPRRPGRSPA
jgi:hypothetical protein